MSNTFAVDVNDDEETPSYTNHDAEPSTEIEGGEEENVTATQTNSPDSSKTSEQLDQERREAVKAMLSHKNVAKTAQAQVESSFNTMLNAARKNPVLLDSIYEEDPDLADRLTAQLPQYQGMTYQKAVNFETSKTKESSKDDELAALIQKEVDKRLKEETSTTTQQEIADAEEEFFIALTRQHDPKSFQFQEVMKKYKAYKKKAPPVDVDHAAAYFTAAQNVLRKDDGFKSIDIGAVPTLTPRSGRSQDTGPMPSEGYIQSALDINKNLTRKQVIATYRKHIA